MGYSIRIGEAVVEYDNGEYPIVTIGAKTLRHEDRPTFDEPTDKESQRWPSYSSWHQSMEWAGLKDMMFEDEDALLGSHPGAVPITSKHRDLVNKAYEAKVALGIIPSYENTEGDSSLMVRLEWLHYWVNFAVDNLEQPVFCNT
jgi:hypothetical protein